MLIFDFYVDEPACFGVPPYLSPYARYAAGAIVAGGVPEEQIQYLTVDAWRAAGKVLASDPELILVIAGATVPGKYLGGRIGTLREVLEFLEYRRKYQRGSVTLVGGPIRYASPEQRAEIEEAGGILIRGDLELYAERLARHPKGVKGGIWDVCGPEEKPRTGERHTYDDVNRWAPRGAFLTRLHPNFPYLILELETYRGCTRDVFCSFCTEAFYGKPVFRSTEGIAEETRELHKMGNRYFRLGRQADLMTYLPHMDDFKKSFPRPEPESLRRLYTTLRAAAPDLKMLHLDNINPGLIATFPDESREIARIICEYNTPGDTAAMGLESVDPVVIERNDLKCTADEAIRAIEIINEFGARRENGIPKLLPGLNLIHGLAGETDTTFQRNYEFLLDLMQRGLLLRRINIRRAVSFSHTKLDQMRQSGEADADIPAKRRRPKTLEEKFVYYRDKIRHEVDRPMLLKSFPPGTILREVIPESQNQGYILGRPLGSYPVTVKIPLDDRRAAEKAKAHEPIDVIIVGAEERSLVGISYPMQLTSLGTRAIEQMPGIGRARAGRIAMEQPASFEELAGLLEGPPFGTKTDYVFS